MQKKVEKRQKRVRKIEKAMSLSVLVHVNDAVYYVQKF